MYFRIVHPLNDTSTHFMTDIWSWLDLHLLTASSCVSTVVLIKCSVAVRMHGELWLLVWNIRSSVYYDGDVGWHGSGLCQKLSANVWALGKLWHFWESVNLHSAGVGNFLLPTINANFFCIKSDVNHGALCLQWQNTGVVFRYVIPVVLSQNTMYKIMCVFTYTYSQNATH
jgi:hypothetical protein